jgi:hypothetical protein
LLHNSHTPFFPSKCQYLILQALSFWKCLTGSWSALVWVSFWNHPEGEGRLHVSWKGGVCECSQLPRLTDNILYLLPSISGFNDNFLYPVLSLLDLGNNITLFLISESGMH